MIYHMVMAVHIGIRSKEWLLEATPPKMDQLPEECSHLHVKRSGNKYGRYAQGADCKVKWVWDNSSEKWVTWPSVPSSGKSSSLPLPSSSNTVEAPPPQVPLQDRPAQAANKMGGPAAPTSKAAPRTTSTRRSPPSSTPWDLLQDSYQNQEQDLDGYESEENYDWEQDAV